MFSVVEFTNVCVYSCVAGSVDEVDVRVSHIHMSYTCVFGIHSIVHGFGNQNLLSCVYLSVCLGNFKINFREE